MVRPEPGGMAARRSRAEDYAELRPQVVAEAKRLRRKRPKGGQRSFRQIANELFRAGTATRRVGPSRRPRLKQWSTPDHPLWAMEATWASTDLGIEGAR